MDTLNSRSSLFSLIITTTLAMIGSAYALRNAKEREAGAQTLIIGANVLYGVLSVTCQHSV